MTADRDWRGQRNQQVDDPGPAIALVQAAVELGLVQAQALLDELRRRKQRGEPITG